MLATLLEGVGYLFKIFECEFNLFNVLWCEKAVKLDNYLTKITLVFRPAMVECSPWGTRHHLVGRRWCLYRYIVVKIS